MAHAEARLKEAAKLGFTEAWVPLRPASRGARPARTGDGLRVVAIGHLSELVDRLPAAPPRGLRARRLAATP